MQASAYCSTECSSPGSAQTAAWLLLPPMHSQVMLVGLPGSGKSTFGRALAATGRWEVGASPLAPNCPGAWGGGLETDPSHALCFSAGRRSSESVLAGCLVAMPTVATLQFRSAGQGEALLDHAQQLVPAAAGRRQCIVRLCRMCVFTKRAMRHPFSMLCSWTYVCQDDCGHRNAAEAAFGIAMLRGPDHGRHVVLDRCSISAADRREWLDLALIGKRDQGPYARRVFDEVDSKSVCLCGHIPVASPYSRMLRHGRVVEAV
jgi:hypothetical protein